MFYIGLEVDGKPAAHPLFRGLRRDDLECRQVLTGRGEDNRRNALAAIGPFIIVGRSMELPRDENWLHW
jgi:hypothetical protein